jgi:putative ABC transport system substrate-binding protein
MSYSVTCRRRCARGHGAARVRTRGAKPGDLPIQQIVKYTLVINMNTAKALGLKLPLDLLGLIE